MTDKEEINKTSLESTAIPAATAAAQPDAQRPPPAADAPQVPFVMSKGEKWYNRIVYQILNYWANLGISLAITDIFMHGKGKLFFDRNAARIAHGLSSTGMMGRNTAVRVGEIILGTFTLNSGGNLLVVPTKIGEDNKRPIVHFLNKYVFGDKQLAADGHEKTPEQIDIVEEQPKQSWWNIIKRRLLGLVATTSVGLTIDGAFAKKLARPIMENGNTVTHITGQERFTDVVVKGAGYVLNMVPAGQKIAANPAVKRYMRYFALDWIYTIITSKLLHMTNGAEINPSNIEPPDAIKMAEAEHKPVPKKNLGAFKKDKVQPAGSFAALAQRPGDLSYSMT